MWGAIIGDIAGSIYEFKQLKGIKPIECNEIIPQNGFYTRIYKMGKKTKRRK